MMNPAPITIIIKIMLVTIIAAIMSRHSISELTRAQYDLMASVAP